MAEVSYVGKTILVIGIEYYVNMKMNNEVKYEHATGASLPYDIIA